MEFYEITPTLENYWRGIILFGKNSASYKFALGKSLIDLAGSQNDLIKIEDLAVPYSKYLCGHIEIADKQGNSDGEFLRTCRKYNLNEVSHEELISKAIRLGFGDVLKAFHNVPSGEVPVKFFIEEGRGVKKGIRITDNFLNLFADVDRHDLYEETESRWRLVETAWELNVSRNLIAVSASRDGDELYANNRGRRINITSSRPALNGYQKGSCFYCYGTIEITAGSKELADVDHFLPHTLMVNNIVGNLDGVWNLVLACQCCNSKKSSKLPAIKFLERIHRRNEYLITSHHPLRETLIRQTGNNEQARVAYLQDSYNKAKEVLIHTWEPDPKGPETF
ncbi:HNH endonuclease domain-containing protein [Oceanicoccus sagamiensis]|uniref:HNH endonuclease n=1 Tax=Oceanicoccus sagamiensis TaxID=716816 RepID=A0A1X9NHA1_9GAMM|nr:HNH endonuclease domain-containing protein [Oceanicoccus sagamiensis]ARN74889.1 HNH endonuclease [Oceanicoccus sagamiensis]